VAYSAEGKARSGMGVDAADFNDDGWMDLFVANNDGEMYSLYQNNHDETFDNMAKFQRPSRVCAVDRESGKAAARSSDRPLCTVPRWHWRTYS
jgi:VCBS repeat protein